MQVLGAAGPLQLAGLGELVGDGDDVGGLAVRVQREDRVEDDLVLGNVEVDAADGLDDVGDRVLAEQHAAERALLGEQIVRGGAFAPSGLTVVRRVLRAQMCAIDNWMTSDLRAEELACPGPLFSLAGATDMGSATDWQTLVEGR